MYAQRLSHPEQMTDLHFLSGFHALHRVAGELGCLPQSLLGPVELMAADADAVTDRFAGVDDPGGMVGRHDVHAVASLILCLPQMWGVL